MVRKAAARFAARHVSITLGEGSRRAARPFATPRSNWGDDLLPPRWHPHESAYMFVANRCIGSRNVQACGPYECGDHKPTAVTTEGVRCFEQPSSGVACGERAAAPPVRWPRHLEGMPQVDQPQ